MTSKYNLVIPMAGLGSRFSKAGYALPKPLLPVGRYRMFELVVANMSSELLDEISIVAPASFALSDDCKSLSQRLGKPVHLIEIDYTTEGPAVSALLALSALNSDQPLVIANSDQFLDFEPTEWISGAISSGVAGSILCMQDDDPKWSFAKLDRTGAVTEVVEKKVISNLATCGVYFFQSGKLFKSSVESQIEQELRVNGEYYVGPAYNHLIAEGARVGVYDLGPVSQAMFGLGIPEDYEYFVGDDSLIAKANSTCERWLN